MGNINSYNKLLSKVKHNYIFKIYNFNDSLKLYDNEKKIIKKYKELYLVIELDSIHFFSKNLKLKYKLYLKDISSWKTNFKYSYMEILYDNFKIIQFGSLDINNISNSIYNKSYELSKLNLNLNNLSEESLSEENLSEESLSGEFSNEDYLNLNQMPN